MIGSGFAGGSPSSICFEWFRLFQDELAAALHKVESLRQPAPTTLPSQTKLLNYLAPSPYKERLLVKAVAQLSYLPVAETAYCYADEGVTFVVDRKGHRLLVDYTLAQLMQTVDAFGEQTAPNKRVHPVFGPLTTPEWGQFSWIHLNYHLTQFGV